ncbi:NUDIX domain-containing protein [Novosphingobium sp. BW1]|uniref:NUDIX domain-containing protein n=1 Tax=Novosphingobium sp. BW1 TaxID=2592621 RepID=UPI002110150D|nr:NUDIX domain-containing protein [Novosphingobium sp. BW1]
MAKNLTPLVVVAVALVDAQGHVLMQQRPEGTMHAGLWEFPGGKVDPGESAEQAAVREMEEELAVGLDSSSLVPVGFASGLLGEGGGGASGRRALVLLLYATRAWEGTPVSQEGGQAQWYAPQGLGELAMPPLDYPLADALKIWLNHDSSEEYADRC